MRFFRLDEVAVIIFRRGAANRQPAQRLVKEAAPRVAKVEREGFRVAVDVKELLHRDAHGVLADRLHDLLRHRYHYRISQGDELLKLGHKGDALLGLLARALLHLGVGEVVGGLLLGTL